MLMLQRQRYKVLYNEVQTPVIKTIKGSHFVVLSTTPFCWFGDQNYLWYPIACVVIVNTRQYNTHTQTSGIHKYQ